MRWGDITRRDIGKRVSVWYIPSKKRADEAMGPYYGVIAFNTNTEIPHLIDYENRIHYFSFAFSVAFL